MASAPRWKVYDCNGTYQAACKEPEAAAVLVSFYGGTSTIRYGHDLICWREGYESIPASESFDTVAITCIDRRNESIDARA